MSFSDITCNFIMSAELKTNKKKGSVISIVFQQCVDEEDQIITNLRIYKSTLNMIFSVTNSNCLAEY